jgi:hypothetical protein
MKGGSAFRRWALAPTPTADTSGNINGRSRRRAAATRRARSRSPQSMTRPEKQATATQSLSVYEMHGDNANSEMQEFIDALQVFVLELEAGKWVIADGGRDLVPIVRRVLDSARTIADILKSDRTLFEVPKS